jgi:hypothetical protein
LLCCVHQALYWITASCAACCQAPCCCQPLWGGEQHAQVRRHRARSSRVGFARGAWRQPWRRVHGIR